MEKPRILTSFPQTDLKLCQKVCLKAKRSFAIPPENVVEIRLDSFVESKFHFAEALPRVGRK